MPHKPLKESDFRKHIKKCDWKLKKGSIDWNLCDENDNFLCCIKIVHGNGKKHEVSAHSVKKTENLVKERGWLWPPKKK
ncbi:MAG: hypothetical protein ABFQ95_01010 [Pseudomonadota bacterium]